MSELGSYFGSGMEGILYRKGNIATKVFHDDPLGDDAKREYELLTALHSSGLPVPQPFEITEVELLENDLVGVPDISRRINSPMSNYIDISASRFIGKTLPAIRREFISGSPLNQLLVPSWKVRRGVQDIQRSLEKQGYFNMDIRGSNFVRSNEGTIYLTDFGGVFKKSDRKLERIVRGANNFLVPSSKWGDWVVAVYHQALFALLPAGYSEEMPSTQE